MIYPDLLSRSFFVKFTHTHKKLPIQSNFIDRCGNSIFAVLEKSICFFANLTNNIIRIDRATIDLISQQFKIKFIFALPRSSNPNQHRRQGECALSLIKKKKKIKNLSIKNNKRLKPLRSYLYLTENVITKIIKHRMFAAIRVQRFKLDRTKNIRNESNNAMME